MLQKRAQPIQPRVPEFLVALEPFERHSHRSGVELAVHDAADLFPLDQAGILEDRQMLDDARQRHADRRGQLSDRALAMPQPEQDRAPRRIGERAEDRIEAARRIVNHKVKCARELRARQAPDRTKAERPMVRGPVVIVDYRTARIPMLQAPIPTAAGRSKIYTGR